MRKEKIVNFQNIAPGQTAILTLPIGPTYEKIKINLGGTLTTANVGLIVGKIDGKPFFTVNAADLVAENLYDGQTNPNTLLLLDFTQKNAKSSGGKNGATSQAAEMLLACLPSKLMQSLTFEISLAAGAPAGSTMTAFAQLADPSGNPFVLKQSMASFAFPNAQDNDLPLPVGSAGAIIKQMFFHQTSGAGSISYVQVRNNGVIIFEGAPSDLQGDQTDYGKVNQAGLTVLDFYLQGLREKLLNTTLTGNCFVRLTTTGGPVNLTGYTRYIDPINRK